jgi:organic radical activating enzyme
MITTLNDSTTSLCTTCYRHVDATTFIENGKVYLEKTCPEHGYEKYLVEKDADFYVNYQYPKRDLQKFLNAVCLDITNRCNLNCPHCYQIPDSKSQDTSIDAIISQIKKWPSQRAVVLMGAEPTVRNDLPELIEEINKIALRPIMILTNGVNLSRIDYASQFTKFDNVYFTFGLNHPDYQGHVVRYKQEDGLKNCKTLGLKIKNISYTIEGFYQLEYCLNEIQQFNKENQYCNMYRIRVGADIGRCPDQEKMFISELVKRSRNIAEKNNWSFVSRSDLGIRAHYPVEINNVLIKLIQWPDVGTLDLDEIQTESWADMLPNYPPSPLVHQVILRDQLINKNIPLLDVVEEKYRMR